MSRRSCSIPLVVRLRGVPDEGRLTEMTETIARTVGDRLSEAASAIAGLEGWTSYRENHTPPAIRFSGGSLDTTLQRRVAAAIEAGIARAISSASGAVAGSASPPLLELPQSSATPAAAPPRLEPQETETGWSLNGISVFKVQRPDGEAASSRLDFQPLLSTNSDGSTKLLISIFRDPNVIVLLQPDAISRLTHLASEIDIRDIVTVAAPEDRSPALGAPPSTEISPPAAIRKPAAARPSLPIRQELQAIDIPPPAPSAAIPYPQFVASPLLPSSGHGSANSWGASPQLRLDEAADVRATERDVVKDQPEWSSGPSLGSNIGLDTAPQSPDAPSRSECHDVPSLARYDSLQQLTGMPESSRVVGTPFDKIAADEAFGEGQQRIDRVIALQSRILLTEEEFAVGVEQARGPSGMILPYKKAGEERSDASPIHASRLPGGRVWVQLREDIFATAYAADQDLRLPPAIGKGVELDETAVVGVKFIDEGVLSFVPALLLTHLENDATRAALTKAGETLASGRAMGARPEPAAEGADGIAAERPADPAGEAGLAWADRIALDLDLADSRVREHRERIIATSPDTGAADPPVGADGRRMLASPIPQGSAR
jgi:hypothetical protein